jgi:hypothetical protein
VDGQRAWCGGCARTGVLCGGCEGTGDVGTGRALRFRLDINE